MADLVALANPDAAATGAAPMQGHTESFLLAYRVLRERVEALGLDVTKSGQGREDGV